MKISILSMQRIINYGSFLQSYALKKLLEKLGYDVNFIDILPGEYKETTETLNDRNFLSEIIDYLKNGKFVRTLYFKKSGKDLKALLIKNQKEILGLTKKNQIVSKDCDAVVIGSDEVFNCNPKCSWGVSTQLFGNIDVPLVISYAASCGYTVYDDVPSQCISGISNALHNLSAVSVRDKNTFDFVNRISGIIPEIHLDPVLIYDFEKEVYKAEKELNFPKKYMIVYSYPKRINKKEEIDMIVSYAKKHRLKIYCVGGEQLWCDEFPVLTPFQVLAAFKNADCIVTDTFHGTIISAKYNKKFAIFVRDSNANKLNDLIERLGLEERRIINTYDFDTVMNSEMDYTVFNQKIKENKLKTMSYLERNLFTNY